MIGNIKYSNFIKQIFNQLTILREIKQMNSSIPKQQIGEDEANNLKLSSMKLTSTLHENIKEIRGHLKNILENDHWKKLENVENVLKKIEDQKKVIDDDFASWRDIQELKNKFVTLSGLYAANLQPSNDAESLAAGIEVDIETFVPLKVKKMRIDSIDKLREKVQKYQVEVVHSQLKKWAKRTAAPSDQAGGGLYW